MKASKIVSSVGILGLGPTLAQATFISSPPGLEHVLSQRWPGASIDYKQVQHFFYGPEQQALAGTLLQTLLLTHHYYKDVNLRGHPRR